MKQAYVDDAFELRDGILRIWATRQPTLYHGKLLPYRSGILTTKDRLFWRHGMFVIRCRLPRGRGLWPTFWLLAQRPDDRQIWPPEIDIIEALGSEPRKATFNCHYTLADGSNANQYGEFAGPDFTQEFHQFACIWSSQGIVWLVDGVERHRTTVGIPDVPMYLLVNLAVGGKFPNAVGQPPDESTPKRASLDVDYIRVYVRSQQPAAAE